MKNLLQVTESSQKFRVFFSFCVFCLIALSYTWGQNPVITFSGKEAEGENSFYSSALVTMTCDAKDAKILYTINGSEPILGSKSTYQYFEPFTMTKSCTFKAAAFIDNEKPSNTVSKTLNIILPTVEAPVIAVDGEEVPGTDTYFNTAKVSIKCATEGSTIYYTLDGSEPTWDSKIYTEPFEVNTTCIINAIAIKDDYNNSAVASKLVTIVFPMVSTPTFEPAGGIYTEKVAVTISCKDKDAEIHYTLDQSEPTEKSPVYKEAIEITESTTIKAIAIVPKLSPSEVATAIYTFPVMVKNIKELKEANTETNGTTYKITGDVTFVYRNEDNIFISDETGGLLIYDQGSQVIKEDYKEGDVISGGIIGTCTLYHGMVEMVPTFNPAASEKNNGAVVPVTTTISDIAADYNKYETILVKLEDVTFPEGGYFAQDSSNNANINQGETAMVCRSMFKNIALDITEGAKGDVFGFVIRYDSTFQIAPRDVNDIVLRAVEQDTVATPVITYEGDEITITCTTEGATIYYTTDTTEPDTTSNLYCEPFAFCMESFTIKAIAMKEGMVNSAVATLTIIGINDYAQSVSTYPNPTTGNVTISYNNLQVTNILVYSANGQLIQSMNATPSQTVINLSNQANGLYFIRLVGDNVNLVKKIHKN